MGYGQTEATDGFGASKRYQNDPAGSSDCRLVMFYNVVGISGIIAFDKAEAGNTIGDRGRMLVDENGGE
jgi:hypothetical protein